MKNNPQNILFALLVNFFLFNSVLIGQSADFLEPWFWGPSNNNHYILTRELVQNTYDNDISLFALPYKGSLVYIDKDNLVTFIADPIWNRIVYGNYYDTWTKVYGGVYGSGTGEFKHPNDIATDGLGNIYVVDRHNGRIVHLRYDENNQEIDPNYFQSLGAQYLERPVAVDVDDRGNTNPDDDIIWVVDDAQGKIYPFNTSGILTGNGSIDRLINPATGANYTDLTGLSGIAIRKVGIGGIGVNSTSNRRLYLVNWKTHTLFLAEAEALENGSVNIYREKTIGSSGTLTDVTSDYFGDVWVVDQRNDRILKYTWDLEYLDQLTGLNRPTGIASTRRHHLNVAVTEQWTDNTGNRTYQQGANARNITIGTSNNIAVFQLTLTNFGFLTAEVFSGSTLMATLVDDDYSGILPEPRASGDMQVEWDAGSLTSGWYTLKLTARAYDDPENNYKEITQNFAFPLRVTIDGPISASGGENVHLEAKVNGGVPPLTDYHWWYKNLCGGVIVPKMDTTQYRAPCDTWMELAETSRKLDFVVGGDTKFRVQVGDQRGDVAQAERTVTVSGLRASKPTNIAQPGNIPKAFQLSTNYPNPFNASTTIHYEIPRTSSVDISIYNLRGEIITTLIHQKMAPGYYDFQWDASEQASGVYIIRFSSPHYVQTQKALLLK